MNNKSLEENFQEISCLFASLNYCEENDVCIIVTRDLNLEDLTGKVSYEIWAYDRNSPQKGAKASATESINNAAEELYNVIYNDALLKQKQLGDAFIWSYQKANKIISEKEDLLNI